MTDYLKIKRLTLFFFPLILFVFNFISKFLFLTHEGIGLDEPFTIYHAQFDAGTIIEQLKNYNNPPLFELLLHPWIKLFGISPLSVRMLPLIFASLSPVVLYYFGKRFFSVQIAVTSSLLLSVSDLLFYYAHDCRVYSLFLLLSLLSMYFFLEILEKGTKGTWPVLLYIVFSCLLIYAHYFGIFILFFQGIQLLFFYKGKWLKFLGYCLIIFLLYLPHLYPLIIRMGDSVKNGTWLGPPNGLESLYNMLWAFNNFPFITVVSILILVISLIKVIVKKDFLRPDRNTVMILIWFLFPFFGMFVISYAVPMYISRYLIFALPAYYILMVICVQYLLQNLVFRNFVFCGLIISFGCTIDFTKDKKHRINAATEFISAHKDSTTLVIVRPHDLLLSFAYYYDTDYFASVGDEREYHSMDSLLRRDNICVINTEDEFTALNKRFEKIIYFTAGSKYNDPNSGILKFVSENYTLAGEKSFSESHSMSSHRIKLK